VCIDDGAEIGLSWQVLTRQAVGMFVASALACAGQICGIEIALQAGGNVLMIGELLAVVGGEGGGCMTWADQSLDAPSRARWAMRWP